MNILIVDDNPRMRALIRSMLRSCGCASCEAADGLEAVEIYEMEAPDVVLMDIRMPRMNGIDATREILRRNASACVVIVTDYDSPQFRSAAGRAGAKNYFLKSDLGGVQEFLLSRSVDRH